MKKGSGTFFVYRRFAFATAINTPVGCLSNRIGCQEIPSRMTWNFCFDQGLERHPRKKSIANEPGVFCRSEASGSLHIHDKSKIPATSTMLQAKKQCGQCIHKGRRKSEIVRDRIVLIHVIDLCISPRSAGETFLAEFLKKEQRFCARSSMHSAAGHGSISSSRRSSWRAGEMFSRFHTAQAGTVSFSSGIKVRFLLAGS